MDTFKVCLLLGVLISMVFAGEAKKKRSPQNDDFDLTSDERLCQRKRCGKRPRGSMCEVVVEEGKKKAVCVCPIACDAEESAPICSVFGRQYENKCFLHKEACKKKKNIKIAYEGPCIASQKKCRAEELRQFPFRLLDWFVHLKDTNEFGSIDPRKTVTSINLEERRETADWKFKQLDRNADGKLAAKELKQFRYALMPLEHCAKDFFKKCDVNRNKKMEKQEWQTCLVDEGWEWFEQRKAATEASESSDQDSDETIE